MIAEIINDIRDTLVERYPQHNTYLEEIPQGFERPCFFVTLLNSGVQKHVGGVLFRDLLFNIRYYPEERKKNQSGYNMEAELCESLHFLEKAKLWSNGVSSSVVGGFLHVNVGYRFRVEQLTDRGELIDSLEIRSGLKDEG